MYSLARPFVLSMPTMMSGRIFLSAIRRVAVSPTCQCTPPKAVAGSNRFRSEFVSAPLRIVDANNDERPDLFVSDQTGRGLAHLPMHTAKSRCRVEQILSVIRSEEHT